MDVLIFGGTAEGRQLVEWLDRRGTCGIIACTATDYGASLLPAGQQVSCVHGPLTFSEKQALVASHDVCCIVDATHPYALHISDSLVQLARSVDVELVRIVRDEAGEGPWTSVRSAHEAAEYLAAKPGNILLTTGSKDLDTYTSILVDYKERLYVRVLPMVAALERADGLGIPAQHVIAMQGPFSEQLNEALISEFDIAYLVTKQSGVNGGFVEKVQAAENCGIDVVVIERPRVETGCSLEEAKTLLEERYGL